MAGYTSVISQLLQIWFYPLYRELGIYTYLVACNFALLVKMPRYQKAATALPVLLDACSLVSLLASPFSASPCCANYSSAGQSLPICLY
jgi:Na+-translocating ferredoxin:NAD+ oxidoreductase RnfE subunit